MSQVLKRYLTHRNFSFRYVGCNPGLPGHLGQVRWNGHKMCSGFGVDPVHPGQKGTRSCVLCDDFPSRLVVVVVAGVVCLIDLPFGYFRVQPGLWSVAGDE